MFRDAISIRPSIRETSTVNAIGSAENRYKGPETDAVTTQQVGLIFASDVGITNELKYA